MYEAVSRIPRTREGRGNCLTATRWAWPGWPTTGAKGQDVQRFEDPPVHRDRLAQRGGVPVALQEANALRGMSMGLTQFAGPALAGLLIVTVGPGYALAIDAASFGVSAFYLARLYLPLHVGLPPQSFARDLLDGWREFVARTWVWLPVVSASLGNMMDSVWLVLAAVWIKNGHGGAGAWTAILVVSAIGALAAGATALRLKPRRPLLLASIAVVPIASPIIVLALKLPWETLVVTALVTGFGNMLFNTLWETTLQQHVPPASLSRASAPMTGSAPCCASHSDSPSQEWWRLGSG